MKVRNLRTGPLPPKDWEVEDIMAHLSCDETTANRIMEDCRKEHQIRGYGAIEKHLILEFIEDKQREEREREARYKADIATAESFAVLKEQLKTLKEMCDSSAADARKAYTQSLIAAFISGIYIAIAILALVLKLN